MMCFIKEVVHLTETRGLNLERLEYQQKAILKKIAILTPATESVCIISEMEKVTNLQVPVQIMNLPVILVPMGGQSETLSRQ